MSRTATLAAMTMLVVATLACATGCANDDSSPPSGTVPPQEPSPNPGQVVVDARHPAWFRYHEGGPFFLCGAGDPEDFLYRGSRLDDGTRQGDQDEIIAKLAESGANGLYMQMVRSHGGDGESDHNPFVDGSPDNPLDEDILAQWDGWFRAMDQAGILVFLFFYDDGSCLWDCNAERDKDVPQEEAEFVRALVNRFKDLRHLVWVIAEEYEEAFHPQRIRNLAHLIHATDHRQHPVAVHKLAGFDFAEFESSNDESPQEVSPDAAFTLEQFAIQSSKLPPPELHDALVSAFERADGRCNLNMAEMAEHGTGREARLTNWAAAMAGAYVMVFGWDVATTSDEDLQGCGILRRFMEGTPLMQLSPRDDLAAAGTDYVLGDADSEPHTAILYASEASETLGLTRFAAPRADLTWVDPITGQILEQIDVQPLPPASEDDNAVRWPLPEGWSGEVAVYVRPSAGR